MGARQHEEDLPDRLTRLGVLDPDLLVTVTGRAIPVRCQHCDFLGAIAVESRHDAQPDRVVLRIEAQVANVPTAGGIQQPHDGQQRGFSTSRRAADGYEFPALDIDVDTR